VPRARAATASRGVMTSAAACPLRMETESATPSTARRAEESQSRSVRDNGVDLPCPGRSELEPAHLAHAGPGARGRRQVELRPCGQFADGRRTLWVTGNHVGDGDHVADRVRPTEHGALE